MQCYFFKGKIDFLSKKMIILSIFSIYFIKITKNRGVLKKNQIKI